MLKRVLGAPLRRIREFFNQIPDDSPLTDTLGTALNSREGMKSVLSGLGEHIEALRWHLLRSLIALLIATGFCFFFAETLMQILAVPVGAPEAATAAGGGDLQAWLAGALARGADGISRLQAIEPTESIGVFMRVALLGGAVIAMPWLVMELYLFIAPGLMPRSRVLLFTAIPVVSLLFIGGVLFCYLVMLPVAIPFLQSFLGFQQAWRPAAYFELVTTLMFWVGVIFEMPFVAFLLASIGFLRARQLASAWRFALLLIAIVAAVITPTTDPVNMALVALPMVLLYLISILAAAFAGIRRDKPARRPNVTR
jgi:sec-independent protein translocase protein TatC